MACQFAHSSSSEAAKVGGRLQHVKLEALASPICMASVTVAARMATTDNSPLPLNDDDFMGQALQLAQAGADAGEVPVGALVLLNDRVVGMAHNAPIALVDPSAHAEVLALRRAAHAVGNYRLNGATLYVTVEPCAMCVGAAIQARVERVVFGCRDAKAGALGSVFDLMGDGRLNHRFSVTTGVRADEAGTLLQEFFRVRRGA